MTKAEVLELGVPESKYRDFQVLYNRDLQRTAKKSEDGVNVTNLIRSAIFTMLKLIQDKDDLRNVLGYVNEAYLTRLGGVNHVNDD